MGLDCASIRFLCAAKSMGVDFSRTMMIGRQVIHAERTAAQQVLAKLGISGDPDDLFPRQEHGEPFFKLLGASEVQSTDMSNFEGATFIHDMNIPLPNDEHRNRYSVVHDGGSLEHIFNLPQSFKNCMEMVAVGGHFTQVTCANNYMGHGFWQFSPEAIYRIFSPENGFRLKAVLLHEVTPNGRWYHVDDPVSVRSRVELCNSVPTYIMTIAERTEISDIFARIPQQSDYTVMWANKSPTQAAAMNFPVRRVTTRLKRIIKSHLGRKEERSPFRAGYYHQISEDNLLAGHIR